MARSHVMTPARRAALRKAQLVSARKRRKHGLGYSAKRAGRQTLSTARAGGSLATRRAVRKFNSPANRRIARHVAVGAVAAGGIGAGAVLGHKHGTALVREVRVNRHLRRTYNSKNYSASWGPAHRAPMPRAIAGHQTRALTMGPKGKAAMRSRRYRARKRGS